ncbi:type II toxin-antitoxin system RelE/ParE family toxin [Bradyrhizobium sp.]|uniref:type II toxin-antitoxin system RelE/ParE family toxin n=1 Tax=Bradyrhizobium sp. TaxID=376 RepID=UPI00239E3058|nr:type II toxin-antitoxin system RelE/ParE family toxin [Bradyrhizobium sp.]MDE2376713.1 type II toxin-antitoxin system RelE/ParE family toxin [Bradyrhizobium sp.]
MELVFDDQAVADLEGIFNWIAQESPVAAKKVMDRLLGSIEQLTMFPFMGHVGRVPGAYEWVVPRLPYVVVYQVDELHRRVVIAAIFHGSQDRDE